MYPLDVGSTHPHAWTWREAIATPTFWLIMASGTLSFFSLRMVTVHQVAHLVDHGVPRLIAATVLGYAGLISAIAFILLGFLSDHAGREVAFVLGSVAQIGALGILMVVWNGIPISMLYLYSVLWGIGEGSRSGLLTAIANDIFPGPSRATIVGSLVSLFAIGAGVGSWSGGAFYDRGGTYTLAFGLALVATSVATGCLLLTRKFRSSPEPGIIPVTSDE
jgi:MFS family permease